MYNPGANTNPSKPTQGQGDDFYIPKFHLNPQEEGQSNFNAGVGVPLSSVFNLNTPLNTPLNQYTAPPTGEYDPTYGSSDMGQHAIYNPSEAINSSMAPSVDGGIAKRSDSSVNLEGSSLTKTSHLSNLSSFDIFSLSDPDFARLGPKSSVPIPSSGSLSLKSNELPEGFEKQRHEPDTRSYDAVQTVEYISANQSGTSLRNAQYVSIEERSGIVPLTARNPERGSELEVPLNSACDSYVDELMLAKKMFDPIAAHLFTAARNRSNPYETLRSSALHQRNAIKMANIDAVTGISTQIELLPEENEKLYYCDLNGEKGGFVEYICWKYKQYGSQGWGMTPKSNATYQLNRFSPDAPTSSFTEVYGKDDSGNIMIEENRAYLNSIINSQTDNRGVALCIADGCVTVPSQENRQEVLARNLLLSECLTALTILRKGGNFVCKFYDTFTTFTASLLFILFQEFEDFAIFKPLASRPASSEKYIICKGLLQRNPPITKTMTEALEKLLQGVNVISLVDQGTIRSSHVFHEYLKRRNAELAREQLYFLDRIKKCIEDPQLELGETQKRLAKECAVRWAVPEPHQRQLRNRGGRGRGRGNRGGGRGHGYGHHQGHHSHGYSQNQGHYNRGRGGYYPRPPHYAQHANISGVRAYGDMTSVIDTPPTPFAQVAPKSWGGAKTSSGVGISKQDQIEMMKKRHAKH